MCRTPLLYGALSLLIPALFAQEPRIPLESIAVGGTTLAKDTVLEITGLRVGAPVDKDAIETACKKLEESGLFQSINYRYQPGPKHGYALTLSLADHASFTATAIDIPGLDEDELWRWLISKYAAFDHRVPSVPSAQEFIARQIEQHAAADLGGQHLVPRIEQEFTPRPRTIISFQPETLPRIASMTFAGQQELSTTELAGILQKVVAGQGYTDRRFRQFVELNLRPAYEEHGMYRVRFPAITVQKLENSSVAVNTTVEEGPKFNLGTARIVGDDLPVETMLKAANFKNGAVANWTQIQQGLYELEKPVKRLGYFAARAKPDRLLHDDTCVLDLNISVEKGPLYHVGQVRFTGLSADLESKARKLWKAAPGDPYDYMYPSDFLQAFGKSADLRQFKKFDLKTAPGTGEHVMDLNLVFEAR